MANILKNQKVRVNPDGTVDILSGVTAFTLSQETADMIFRTVLARNVAEDALSYAEEEEIPLTADEAKKAGILYAEYCRYDCNLSYWENIAAIVGKVKEETDEKI